MRSFIYGLFGAFILSGVAVAQEEAFRIDSDGAVHIPQLKVGRLVVDEEATLRTIRTREIFIRHPDERYASSGEWRIWTPFWKTYAPRDRKFKDAEPKNLSLSIVGPNNSYSFHNSAPRVRFNSRMWLDDDSARSVGKYTRPETVEVSDARLKKDVAPLGPRAFDALRPVTYDMRYPRMMAGGEGRQIGFIADEVEALYPELVFTGGDGYRRLRYGQLTAVLTAALQETRAELATARAELAAERTRLDDLAKRLSALESRAPAQVLLQVGGE